jgi:hypothetical protein
MRAFSSAAALAVLLLAFAAAPAEDNAAPAIVHTPLAHGEKGKQTPVFARFSDESKIFPQLFFRFSAGGAYEKPIDMKVVRGQKNQWGANLPAPPGNTIEYYIEAYDEFGNGPARAGDPGKPFRIDFSGELARQTPPLPSEAFLARRGGGPGGGRVWSWLVGGTGLGLLTGGIVALPGTKGTALMIAGATLIAGGVGLYFLEAPKDVRVGGAPVEGGGAVALAGRF